MTIRIFLAFDISDEIRQNITTFLKPFLSFEGVKWVDPKKYHVTLKFFGNVDEEKELPVIQERIEKYAASLKPVTLTCEGIGFFPRVVWVGFTGETQAPVGQDLSPSTLHLTVGRIKSDLKKLSWLKNLKAAPQKPFGSVRVDRITLYKSQLTKEGSIYTALETFHFINSTNKGVTHVRTNAKQ